MAAVSAPDSRRIAPLHEPPSMPAAPPTLIPVAEIARWLELPEERVAGFISGRQSESLDANVPAAAIPASRVGPLIRDLVQAEGLPVKTWGVPESMHASPHPWERMVAAMYAHPCAHPACLPPEQGRQVREMILDRRPETVLEIGCFMGVSSIWIASALEDLGGDRHLHSIDLFDPILPWPPHRYGYLANPETKARTSAYVAGLDHRITFHRMNSFDLSDRYGEVIGGPVDFAFIDGDHSFDGCRHDLLTMAPHVNLGGAILLHDTNPEFCGWEGPRRVLDRHILPSPHFRVTEIPTEPWNFGMALIEKTGEVPPLSLREKLRLERIRLESRLRRSQAWKSIRETPLGQAMRRVGGSS